MRSVRGNAWEHSAVSAIVRLQSGDRVIVGETILDLPGEPAFGERADTNLNGSSN